MCYSVVSIINQSESVPTAQSPTQYSGSGGSNVNSPSTDYLSYGSPVADVDGMSYGGGLYDDLPSYIDGPVDFLDELNLPGGFGNAPDLLQDDQLGCLWNYPQPTGQYDQTNVNLPFVNNLSAQYFPCKVCGDKASGNHFGVMSCEACKSFFRRSIRTDAKYSCRAGRNCEIDKQSRNRCQYCRLIRCIKVGMKKEGVQDERCVKVGKPSKACPKGLLSRKARCSLTDETATAAGNARESLPGSPSSDGTEGSFRVLDLLTAKEMLTSGKEAAAAETTATIDRFLGAMSAFAVKLVGWAQRIPAFARLNFEDQVRLLKASWCDLYVLHLAVHNGSNPGSLVLGGGLTCTPDQIGDNAIRDSLNKINSHVSSWIQSLSVETIELACLNGILLFNPAVPHLSAEAKKEVEMYLEEILNFLEKKSRSLHSSISQRFSKLLLRLSSIQSISKEMMQYLEVQQTLGHTQMDKLLLELFDAR